MLKSFEAVISRILKLNTLKDINLNIFKLAASALGYMLIAALLIQLPVGAFLGISIFNRILFTVSFAICSGILLSFGTFNKLQKYKNYILPVTIVTGLGISIHIYAFYMKFIFIFIYILLGIFATLMPTRQIIQWSILSLTYIIYLFATNLEPQVVIVDLTYVILYTILFGFVIVTIIVNHLFIKRVIADKLDQNRILMENQREIRRMAYFDDSTGLANKNSILKYLSKHNDPNANEYYLCLFDLNDFKKVNDLLGHAMGDALLKSVSERMNPFLNDHLTLYRYGGDEFIIIGEKMGFQTFLGTIETVNAALKEAFLVEGHELYISASFGVVSYPKDSDNYVDIMKKADLSMYEAKKTRQPIIIYNESYNNKFQKGYVFEREISNGIDREEFYMDYQPIFDVDSKLPTGFEALLRWSNPVLGVIPPIEFIPHLEDHPKFYDLGLVLIEKAIDQLKIFQSFCDRPIKMSINLSPNQLINKKFSDDVLAIIEKKSTDPRSLQFEITETIVMNNFNNILPTLNALREQGIQIALDDFGTGYSSLSYLMDLPIDVIKIDKSFTDRILGNDEKSILIQNIVDIAKNLNLEVIVEGVEEEIQLNYLTQINVKYIQGYYFSKPLNLEELTNFCDVYSKLAHEADAE